MPQAAPARSLFSPSPTARSVERVPVEVYPSSRQASHAVARQMADVIRLRQKEGQRAILGLATGSTPTEVYNELVRMHREEKLSFRNVVTFNLDEYWPMAPDELQSYRRFMREHLFDLVDIEPANAHVPDGTVKRERITEFCQGYEQAIRDAGGIDLQLLGIGRSGHIGFNEPGSPRDSRTRLITLDKITRMDAASDFFGERNVPHKALTMGVETILSARRLVLLSFGEHKAEVIRRAVEGEVSATVAGSYLQQHPSAKMVLDMAAAAELTRFKTPWLLGSLEEFGLTWDARMTRKACLWLALKLGKAILKLTDEDYNEHGLQELLSARGGAYDINIEVFKSLASTITGWPGGKPGASATGPWVSDSAAPQARIFPKRVLVFSPHPDDDVISMGGTLNRLCMQGHEVHVAFQTSGNIAVFDEAALRYADFVGEYAQAFGLGERRAEHLENLVETFIRGKKPGQVDAPELQQIKTMIRRAEARAAARHSGVKPENAHFLDMPFYETGRVRKKPISEQDIKIVVDLLETVKPHQVYAAGDLTDPHGTHRTCLAAVMEALKRLRGKDWMRQCQVWFYRGAWQEWSVEEIEMAVPLSPDEVMRKRMAIFKHESQKDKAMFPGVDMREFWQRAEERNRNTANLYDQLGLAEYEAIEGFVKWRGDDWQG